MRTGIFHNEYYKNAAVYVVTALISVILIAYIVVQLTGFYGENVSTVPATLVTERSLNTLDAYIIRKERLVYSPVSGTINYYYPNGSKVGVDTVLATVYSGDSNRSGEIIRIDNKISLLEASSVGDDMVISDTATLDSRIAQSYTAMTDYIVQNKLDYVINSRDELLKMLNRRQIMVKAVSDYNDRIAYLKAWKQSLIDSLPGKATDIISQYSGYFYNDIDGYEDVFSAVDIDTLTIQGYTSLTEAVSNAAEIDNNAIGKLAQGYAWYIACEIPYADTYNYTLNKNYTIIYPYSGDEEVKAQLYRTITEPNSDRAVLVFKNGYVRSGFSFLRHQSIEIVTTSYTGYRIPITAVRIIDGVKGVYVLNGSKINFRTIVPLYEDNGYIIVEPKDNTDASQQNRLGAYENVIVSNGQYYDGQILK